MNYEKIYKTLVSVPYNGNEKTEIHHIIPRCLGGTDDEDNLVKLSIKQHCFAHKLLVKIYPNNKSLINAANMMSAHNIIWIREKHAESMKGNNYGTANKGRKRKSDVWNKGKTGVQTAWNKGVSQPETSERMKGNKNALGSRSEESKLKMSLIQQNRPKVVCPHCNKEGGTQAMYRWHFDNCKKITISI